MSRLFYASGMRGPEIRADGKGGLLARGWYFRNGYKPDGEALVLKGPDTSERRAATALREWVVAKTENMDLS